MGLINPMKFILKAQEKGAAIASFNVHNLETIQAVVEGAAEENCPVIIQTTPGTLKHAGVEYVSSMVKTASELYEIPIALHVDHCTDFDMILQCIRHGYTSVMIDAAHLPYDENVEMVKKVVEIAHSVGVAVEGELGKIGGTEDDLSVLDKDASFTVPSEAKSFVLATGIDMLAVAIGTKHGEYSGEPNLDFKRLSSIREIVDLPLILHGASGIPNHQIKESLKRGISKINIATELKIPMAEAIKTTFANKPTENDPRKYMGAAKNAVKAVVREKIRLCNGTNLTNEL